MLIVTTKYCSTVVHWNKWNTQNNIGGYIKFCGKWESILESPKKNENMKILKFYIVNDLCF